MILNFTGSINPKYINLSEKEQEELTNLLDETNIRTEKEFFNRARIIARYSTNVIWLNEEYYKAYKNGTLTIAIKKDSNIAKHLKEMLHIHLLNVTMV